MKDRYEYVNIIASHHFALSFTRIQVSLVRAEGKRERMKEEGKGEKKRREEGVQERTLNGVVISARPSIKLA